ncbi:MAG: hypothetical protein ACRDLN_15545, partial [Solirubrobacteraceae bacterium]
MTPHLQSMDQACTSMAFTEHRDTTAPCGAEPCAEAHTIGDRHDADALKLRKTIHLKPACHDDGVLTIEEAREQWSPAGVYLNTASYGLPPRTGFDAMQAALADWRGGRTSWE